MMRCFVLAVGVLGLVAGGADAGDYQVVLKEVNAPGFTLAVDTQVNNQPRPMTLMYGPITQGLDLIVNPGQRVNVQTIFLADSPRFGRVEAVLRITAVR